MSKDRAQFLAAERHKTKIGAQRKADAALAAKTRAAVAQNLSEGRPIIPCFHDLCEAVAAERKPQNPEAGR